MRIDAVAAADRDAAKRADLAMRWHLGLFFSPVFFRPTSTSPAQGLAYGKLSATQRSILGWIVWRRLM